MKAALLVGIGCTAVLTLVGHRVLPPLADAAATPQGSRPTVPFVGCKSDGQAGYRPAPRGKSLTFPISSEQAKQLAFYQAADEGPGVLAPRGWHCYDVYGSNGGALYIAPQAITADQYSGEAGGFIGPAVEVQGEVGDTSGREAVARAIARVFPSHKAFVRQVIEIGSPYAPNDFPFGPYPDDKLTYRSNEMVEFQTPGNTNGLGTSFRLKKNDSPISGVAILLVDPRDATPDLLQLSVRLPRPLAGLTPIIIQQFERSAGPAEPGGRENGHTESRIHLTPVVSTEAQLPRIPFLRY
jgi:hypothetical protein